MAKNDLSKIRKKLNGFTSDQKEMDILSKRILSIFKESITKQEDLSGSSTPNISTQWDNRRKKLASKNKTSKYYNAGSKKTSFSFTGDTLKGVVSKAIIGAKTIIEIYGKGTHSKMIGVRGKTLKGSNAPIREIFSGLIQWYKSKGLKLGNFSANKKAKDAFKKQFLRYLRRR
ncbi:MAG: hypothetical protein OEL89_00675 [Candidatus Peregrinibacteria bacterium]|nr:hypothetical protein [Candidatus Peregrinibacteria bacterium]